MIQNINTACQHFEAGLSVAAMIPGVNFISASIRKQFATCQIIAGLASTILNYTGSLFCSDNERSKLYEQRAAQSIEYVKHGVLNLGRAFLEFIPFVGIGLVAIDQTAGKMYYYKDLTQQNPDWLPDFN